MVAAINTFRYPPLPHSAYIRVCTLLAGSIRDPIQCTVESVVLNPIADYEADSYLWGDAGNESYIDCDNAQLEVRPNLKSSLQHLRNADRPRSIRLDRICINQNCDVEKSHQLAIMGDIFGSATSCLVSDMLRSDVNMLAKEMGIMNERALPGNFEIPLPIDEFWKVVNRMLDQTWFSRTWTYKEILPGRNVQLLYGDRCMPFNVDQASTTGPVYSFEPFLFILKALLSVPQHSKDIGIFPDYSSSAANVCTATARRLIERYGLLVLSYVESQINKGRPLEVPDWTQRQREGFGIGCGNRNMVCNTTGSSKPLFGDLGNRSKLSNRGVFFDTVTSGKYADNKNGWSIDHNVLDGGEWFAMATDIVFDYV